MDVRCPRCHVEYEFDDDKVTGAGVAVQCTGCGHVFRVASKTPHPPTTTAGVEREEWMVRQSDGRTIRFKELTTLQKWIVEQKVARTDEISRTGRTWRPLGDIAELSSFFQVVDAARAAQSMAAQGIVSAPVMPPPNIVLPVVDPAQHTMQLVSDGPMPTPRTPVEAPAPSTPPIQTASTETFFGDDPTLDALDDDDPVKALRARGRTRRAATLALIVVVAAIGSLVVLRPDLRDRALALLSATRADDDALEARVMRALIDDKEGELEAVDKVLETALARDPRAALHALRARTLTARARTPLFQRFTARDDDARAALDRAAAALVDGAASHALSALADPSVERAARLAHADVQGARGALLEMESDLDLAVKGDASPETMREVAVIRALGGVRRALDARARLPISPDDKRALSAQIVKAQALSPDDTRLAFATAIVEIASLDRAASTFEADRVARIADVERALVKSPYHLGFRALREHLDTLAIATTATTTASTTTPESGVAPPADEKGGIEKAATGEETGGDDDSGRATKADVKGDGKAEPESFDALLSKAERLRRGDRAKKALALYQRAAALRPSDPRPHIGIGWANLDSDKLSAAVTAFKKALAVDDGAAEAHLGLGEVYRAREEKAPAIASFKAYLRLAPNGEEASVAKRAIEQLERKP